MAGIVVGVDGSPQSQAALDWALDEAVLRNAHLTALAVAPAVSGYWGIVSQTDPSHEEQERVNRAAKEMVDKAAQRHGHQQVTVRTVAGVPADELIKASQDADLLVVSARGGGGFARLRMGSVSTQVTAHAHCPVVVVQSGADH
ncbi:MAG TPA: universal stress protein [Streptosporangiaceae bacterium]|nr:universal stress protein [Streptosporangiaceae bacterium]